MHRSESEHITVYRATTGLFVPNFVQIGRHLGEWRPKHLFVAYNRGRPGLWDTVVNEKTGITLSENRHNQIPRGRQPSVRRVQTSARSTSAAVFNRSFIDLALGRH